MGWLSRLFCSKQEEVFRVNVTVTTETSTEEAPPKDSRKETLINGVVCKIKFHRDRLEALKVKDFDDYRGDDRRWVDIFFKNEKHSYAWPEGYWTHSADNLEEKDEIERWICQELGLTSPQLQKDAIKTTNRQNLGKKYLVHGRAEGILVEATINPKGYVVPFSIAGFDGKANMKTGEIKITARQEPLRESLSVWLRSEFEEIAAKSK